MRSGDRQEPFNRLRDAVLSHMPFPNASRGLLEQDRLDPAHPGFELESQAEGVHPARFQHLDGNTVLLQTGQRDLKGLVGEVEVQIMGRAVVDQRPSGNKGLHALRACSLLDHPLDQCRNAGTCVIRKVVIRNGAYRLGEKDVKHSPSLLPRS